MKTYEEIANRVFERRDAYNRKKAMQRRIIGGVMAAAACVCLIVLFSVGGQLKTAPDDRSAIGMYDGRIDGIWGGHSYKEGDETSVSYAVSDASKETAININHINAIPTEKLQSECPLLEEDRVILDKAGINKYYGTDIFPYAPDDLEPDTKARYLIYRHEGVVYWDQNFLNYANGDGSRRLYIEVKKGTLPVTDMLSSADFKVSRIGGTDVCIAYSKESGQYYAELMYRDTGFRIVADGLSQNEVVNVLKSLLD